MFWRFEVNNALTFAEWRPLWVIDKDQLAASQELRYELNKINVPIQLLSCSYQEARL
jgi:hypothetical protein